jgi:hypothetical protein
MQNWARGLQEQNTHSHMCCYVQHVCRSVRSIRMGHIVVHCIENECSQVAVLNCWCVQSMNNIHTINGTSTTLYRHSMQVSNVTSHIYNHQTHNVAYEVLYIGFNTGRIPDEKKTNQTVVETQYGHIRSRNVCCDNDLTI